MFLNPQHLAIGIAWGSGKEAFEVGNRVGKDNPATSTSAQRLRIRRLQEAGGGPAEFMSCQVASGRSFHCIHEVLISVCIECGGGRDKWRGRQMSGGSTGRGTTDPLVPTTQHTLECVWFGPLGIIVSFYSF